LDDSDGLFAEWLALAGQRVDATGESPVRDVASAKVVRKHWGEERWLVPEGSPFAFKLIRIVAGKRTSLQLHRRKEEANFMLEGEATLYFAELAGDALRSTVLVPGDIVHLRPGMIHRIEAVRDTSLLEVSTPELDDVIRLEDDLGRGDGRIAAEHL
jgi:mannose-6-phosphate isomerase